MSGTMMTIKRAKALIEARMFPGDYFEMDGIINNHNADKVALKCIDAQLRLNDIVDKWEFDDNTRFSGDAVKDILSQFVVEDSNAIR